MAEPIPYMNGYEDVKLRLGRYEGGWRVEARVQCIGAQAQAGGSLAFAATEAGELDVALDMLEPFLRRVAGRPAVRRG